MEVEPGLKLDTLPKQYQPEAAFPRRYLCRVHPVPAGQRTGVLLIPDFRDYLLAELQARGILRKLEFISRTKRSNPWRLTCTKDDKNIIQAIEDGLKKGRISIPGSTHRAFAAPGQVRSRPVISLFPIILFPGSIDGAAESNPH